VYLKDGEKVSLDECIGSEKTFQCPSVQALANKLKASSTKYTSHSGFYLLDYLNIANGSVFYDLDEIYIFSDGEFQLQSSTSRDLLKNLNAKTAGIRENKADFPYNSKAKQYPTPQMNEITFNNNRIWIADYRKNAAEILNKHFVHCIE
jgi:predicted heme/steroid binding protein